MHTQSCFNLLFCCSIPCSGSEMVEKVDQAGKSEGHAVLLPPRHLVTLEGPQESQEFQCRRMRVGFFEDFETEFKGDSQMPKYRNIKRQRQRRSLEYIFKPSDGDNFYWWIFSCHLMFLFKEFFKPKSSQHVVFFLASFSCTNWGSNIAWGVKLGVLAGMWQGSSSGYLGWPFDDPKNGGLRESEDDSFTGKTSSHWWRHDTWYLYPNCIQVWFIQIK